MVGKSSNSLGRRTMTKWSPSLARKWSFARLDAIEGALREIAHAWADVDENVVYECDQRIAELQDFRSQIEEAAQYQIDRDKGRVE